MLFQMVLQRPCWRFNHSMSGPARVRRRNPTAIHLISKSWKCQPKVEHCPARPRRYSEMVN